MLLVFVFIASIAYSMGYINEQKADGSILPSWLIHGVSNLFSAILSMVG